MGLFDLFGKKVKESSVPATDAERWVAATYAMWSEWCGGSFQYLGGYEKTGSNASMVRGVLRQDWVISNKESGIEAVEYMLKEISEDKGRAAFDLACACNICGRMYVGGILTREESMEQALKAARLIRKRYSSWQEFAECYIEGMVAGSNVPERKGEFEKIYARISALPDGPYSVDWNLAL